MAFSRDDGIRIVDELGVSKNIRSHLITVEAFMRELARHFGEDEEAWGLVGLLHDADYEATEKDLDRHPMLVVERLRERGAPEPVIHAILAHAHRVPLESKLDRALYACDNLAGLIVAAALVHPERKIAALTPEFVRKKFNQKGFARSANREEILTAEEGLGLPLNELTTIGLRGLGRVAGEVGL